ERARPEQGVRHHEVKEVEARRDQKQASQPGNGRAQRAAHGEPARGRLAAHPGTTVRAPCHRGSTRCLLVTPDGWHVLRRAAWTTAPRARLRLTFPAASPWTKVATNRPTATSSLPTIRTGWARSFAGRSGIGSGEGAVGRARA